MGRILCYLMFAIVACTALYFGLLEVEKSTGRQLVTPIVEYFQNR